MKIALIDFVLEPDRPGASGLSDVVWNMGREFADLGDDVHIIGPYAIDPESYPGITVHRFSLPPLGYRNILGHTLIILRAWRLLRRLRGIDVVIAPEYHSTGIIAPLIRTPVVLITPGNVYERLAHGHPWDWLTVQVYKLMAHSSARYCALVDAISNDMEWWWSRTGVPMDRLVMIPHGVDTSLFQHVSGARTRLGIPEQIPMILYVGRLSHEKNVDVLLQALAKIITTFPDIQLEILGTGPDQARLERLAYALEIASHVRFFGQVTHRDLPSWYSATNVTVLPSSSEGLPRVMLEALACGSPFIGTRISGMVDHLDHGQNGFLTEPRDVDGLAQLLQMLLAKPDHARLAGLNAADYVRRKLSWESVIRDLRHTLNCRLGIQDEVLVAVEGSSLDND